MTVIAMTREMGSRGKQVAAILAERLATRLVYHEVVEELHNPPDAGPSEVRRHLNGDDAPAEPGRAPRNGRMTAFEILESASRGNVILRGWGAVRLLAGIGHIPCIRVCAPMELRIDEMTRRLGIDARAARREIERNDNAHVSVFQRLFGGDWRETLTYDLVLNTARIPPEDCAETIIELVSRPAFQETAESRQALADRLAEARIAAYLAREPGTRDAAKGVYVSVSGGTVTLFGSVRGESAAREIARTVGEREGPERLRNELQTSGAHVNH